MITTKGNIVRVDKFEWEVKTNETQPSLLHCFVSEVLDAKKLPRVENKTRFKKKE